MPLGDDDTVASSLPTLAGDRAEVAEVVAGRYRLVRWLGGGGMGRVYEVLDTELGERVALKVLRAGLSEDAVERFRREVRLTRRIQHRNVARMYDIGEHAGDRFLTMELVDGRPLTRELGAPVPWARLQLLATQVCAGLAAAHAAGVVHRDLKPDNVLVEHGTDRAVITDFGIARSGDDAGVTQVGAVVGTPRYMAPEQLAGSAVDHRADVFSLGVMLYEMATGARPWTGDNPIAIAVVQATQAPAPITAAVPAGFTAIVMQCLALDRDRRPASAQEIGAVIEALAAPSGPIPGPAERPTPVPQASAPPAESTITVLPLACVAGDEYLADGLVEDLVDTLSTTRGLRVKPAGIVRTHDLNPRAVGRELGVDHVLSGSLRRTPAGLRIAARLIGIADGFQIWAERIDCTEAEVLGAADRIAGDVAQALSARAAATASSGGALDPRAVELFLRGRAELRRFWGEHAQRAMELLEQAAAYAPGSGQILSAYAFAAAQAWMRQEHPELAQKARDAVDRALATGHGEAYLAACTLKLNSDLPEAAAADLGTALARAPMSSHVHEYAGRLLVEVGAPVEGRHHFDTALGLDPSRAQLMNADLARLDALEGNRAGAERRLALLLADADPPVVQLGAVYLARLGMWWRDLSRVYEALGRMGTRMGSEPTGMAARYQAWRERGEFDPVEWNRTLTGLADRVRPRRYQLVAIQRMAEFAIMIDHRDEALEALDRAADFGLIDLVWLELCPLFADLGADPRYQAVHAKVAARAGRVLAAFRAAAGS